MSIFLRTSQKLVAALSGAFLATIAAAVPSTASHPEKIEPAGEMVREALSREVYGLTQERQQLLNEAARTDPNYAPTKWHQGLLQWKNEWLTPDEIGTRVKQNDRYQEYLDQRAKSADTAAGQLELALWCREHGLTEQQRAHLWRVLDHSPDHPVARAELGFVRLIGQWVLRSELQQQSQKQEAAVKALRDWHAELERVRSAVRSGGHRALQFAASNLAEIRDPAALPAIEQIVSSDSEDAALLVVDSFAGWNHIDVSQSLARHAILAPWPSVRDAAALQLRNHPLDNYVPMLLASMYSKVTSSSGVVVTPQGRLFYRHAFTREGQDQKELLVMDAEISRIERAGGDARDTISRATRDISRASTLRELTVAQQNQITKIMNDRIAEALNVATNQQMPAAPEAWWQWWNGHNETFVQGDKTTQAVVSVQQVSYTDRVLQSVTGGPGPQRSDCFAAGTEVCTIDGKTPIDKLRVGDLLLSQNPETGELTFKPVLRTTTRPSGRLIRIVTGHDEFQTSGGHLFWVSGEGWVKSRDLKPGMQLHAINGTDSVSELQPGDEAMTYNVVVADFHNYFVGDRRVLSHDNTLRQATQIRTPGLAEAQ